MTIIFQLDNFFIPKGVVLSIVKFSSGNRAIIVFLFIDDVEHRLLQWEGHADT